MIMPVICDVIFDLGSVSSGSHTFHGGYHNIISNYWVTANDEPLGIIFFIN